eukprot:CAMPEP_0171294646 /NCGR_PEP_ID=MMETSP0816-20121228/3145_1 /TAXON_ID=420281 /ORGANISM="Proboscia inermis, Strain CCAP1064/1" /LENGTH=541 /DNA_ID=CAMNT_0011766659 /DNA_START=45 /DNA_END=1670 /DNA_ORIENTATION=-
MATKTPSEWLQLLCRDWANENRDIIDQVDGKFLAFKGYLKGQLTSQLLCRLSIETPQPAIESFEQDVSAESNKKKNLSFWQVLGVEDSFDRSYIVSQVERFCTMFNIKGGSPIDEGLVHTQHPMLPPGTPGFEGIGVPMVLGLDSVQAAAAAAAAVAAGGTPAGKLRVGMQSLEITRAQRKAKDAERALEEERRKAMKREQRRILEEKRIAKARERDSVNAKKASDKAEREAERLDKRHKKLEQRLLREKSQLEQKEQALKRAAELVVSNRVPIEITRGPASIAAANAAVASLGGLAPSIHPTPFKRPRSSIIVSTASDLDQIVRHSNNLWAKYNAIAKEHNQKVNWIVVAKELGIHVKVREKYARMHARAIQRGFDFSKDGHVKIKSNPHIFLEPLNSEKSKAMLPPAAAIPQSSIAPTPIPYGDTHTRASSLSCTEHLPILSALPTLPVVDVSNAVIIEMGPDLTSMVSQTTHNIANPIENLALFADAVIEPKPDPNPAANPIACHNMLNAMDVVGGHAIKRENSPCVGEEGTIQEAAV